ncbi:beta-lactamase domain-containing protein [Agrilactobacillus composti DSM 18527 = JCM 14202]|uniref:Beta-lactamase domain-containing protein n=2 Tax=Agrilactobacillus TaxID=2767875 RepID=A0A0R1XW97_9LACO|nr:beta-lactamase domain-containing protein [Agrilactobacillus composti DSM 18527 = JCM 14202]
MSAMKLTVLGYYGGYPYAGHGTSGYLIQSETGFNLLLECGSGVLLALQKYLDPLQLDAVLLSHYHHDHTADVGVLQYYWQLAPGQHKEPVLPIYGHTRETLSFAALTMPNITQGQAYDPDGVLKLGPFEITFLPTKHPVPAYAMRIEETSTGKVLTFTSDTAYIETLVDFAKDSDLLMTDTNFFDDKTGKIWHMTSTQSGKLAQKAKVKHLLLTHLPQHGDLEKLKKEAEITSEGILVDYAQEGLTIKLA